VQLNNEFKIQLFATKGKLGEAARQENPPSIPLIRPLPQFSSPYGKPFPLFSSPGGRRKWRRGTIPFLIW
jgi:hypothetical protein